jgi:DNA-binding transcriptional ArsR family regulator
MATKRINNRINVDELGCAARRGVARQNSPFVTRLAPRSTGEHLDSEEAELAEAGLVRLPEESLPDSFWKMPAPRVSFVEAVWAVTSERDEG